MDAIIQQVVNGYLSVFDTVPCSDEGVKAEIENYKAEVNTLGEKHTDMMAFMAEFSSSGLEAQQTALITKASQPPADQKENDHAQIENAQQNLPSVSEFLNQYKAAYDAVKQQGYRKNAEKAYENIFDVANRTDDLLEMNIILEKEEMLWKIVSEDLKDIYNPLFEALDPNNTGFRNQFKNLISVAHESLCDDQLTYNIEIQNQKNQKENYRFISEMVVVIQFAKSLWDYHLCKTKLRTWFEPEKDLKALIAVRKSSKRFYESMNKIWGWDIDSVLADPWKKVWMLVPIPLDTLNRIKMTQDVHNLGVYRELLAEILSDKSLEEIMLNEQTHVMSYLLDKTNDQVVAEYTEKARQENAGLTYFQYEEKLKGEMKDDSKVDIDYNNFK